MSYPFAALATLKYKPPPGSSDSLAFGKGERVTVLAAADDDGDWLRGSNEAGHEGIFPAQFVERVDEPAEREIAPQDEPASAVVEAEPAPPAHEDRALVDVPVPVTEVAVESPVEAPVEVESPPAAAPTRQASLPPAPVEPSPAVVSPPAEQPAGPPVAPKKPLSALQARIAALNAAGAGAAPPPGPPPRPSGPKPAWKPKSIPAPAPAFPSPSSPSVEPAPAPIVEKAEKGGEMSAADAQESIGKGGSLKDRIAALQGGLQSFEQPAAPGRAPKPWKRKVIPVEDPEVDAAASQDARAATESAVVSPQLESDSPLPTQSPKSTDDSAASATLAAPPSASSLESSPTEPESTEPAPEPTEEDKKAALVARMAGLGGQRVGMAMPALPRKAGPPRRKAAATPPPASPVDAAPVQPVEMAESKPVVDEPVVETVEKAKVEEPEAVVKQPEAPVENDEAVESSEPLEEAVSEPTAAVQKAASTIVESEPELESETDQTPSVAAPVKVDESHSTKVDDDDDDDFATPDLPSDDDESPTIPPPPTRAVMSEPVKPIEKEYSPEPEVGSEPEDAPEETQYDALPDADDESETPVQAHYDDDEPEPTPAPVLPAGRPSIPPSFEAAKASPAPAARDMESDESDVDSPPAPPLPTGRPSIPSVPATFAPPPKAPTREPISIPKAVVDESAPSSPVTAQRPSIPASFVAPPKAAASELAVVAKPLAIPKALEPEEEDDEGPTTSATSPVVGLPKQAFAIPPTREAQLEQPDEQAEAESEGEEEEEDPEVTRRRNLAARMAKLGGMNMRMGPMMPPIGGMRKVKKTSDEPAPPPADEPAEDEPPRRLPGGIPTGGMLLPGIAPRLPPAPAPVVEPEAEAEQEAEVEPEPEPVPVQDDEPAPPPLPTGRPSSQLAPRRSMPVPQESDDDEIASPLPPTRSFVAEPAAYDEPESEEEEAAPPPPPRSTRPTMSPLLPPIALPPTSPPPTRAVPQSSPSKRTSVPVPARQSTDLRRPSTDANSGLLGISIPRGSLDDDRPPVALAPAVSRASQSSAPSPAQLLEFSTTLGGQVFAAAFSQLSSKARTTQDAFLALCFSRAASAQPPSGHNYGVVVLSSSTKLQIDEPRAGDIVVFHDAKFKHNLTTTKVGSGDAPHVAVVQAWDAKKRKLRAIEVGKDGSVEEGAWRMEDLKSGEVTVSRVVERGWGTE